MFLLKRFSIICVLLLSFGPMVWSQTLPTPPAVYVSGGAPNGTQCNSGVTLCTIYVQSGTGFTPVLSMPAANFESLAIGPDNIRRCPNRNTVSCFRIDDNSYMRALFCGGGLLRHG